MDEKCIKKLKTAMNAGLSVFWAPDALSARQVIAIGTSPEEERINSEAGIPPGTPCGLFHGGSYVDLENAPTNEFVIGCRLDEFMKSQTEGVTPWKS